MEPKLNLFIDKESCCGCYACVNVCTKSAIRMEEDENGFIYPKIDETKCILCGACERVCAYKGDVEMSYPIKGYAAVNKNKKQTSKSASGGLFAALATSIINQGGVVFGAAYDYQKNRVIVKHIAVKSIEELYRLQGSKYVQSDMGDIYLQVKHVLNSGVKVLFSGTPCQVGALKKFLRKEYENLYTIDIICHGIPSQKIFNDYIHCLESKNNITIKNFSFRDKSKAWQDYYLLYDGKLGNERKYKNKEIWWKHSSYFYYFIKCYIYRINCYSCKYACEKRIGDITLGDYWGIEKQHKELFRDKKWINYWYKGISCVLVNSYRGHELFYVTMPNLDIVESTPAKIISGNGQLKHPSCLNKSKRDKILGLYSEDGYEAIDKAFTSTISYKEKLKQCIKSKIPLSLKKSIRILIGF